MVWKQQHFVWKVHVTMDDPKVSRDCGLYHPSDHFCWQCMPLTSPSWASTLEAKHVSLFLIFSFFCQYCWALGYGIFKGWTMSRSCLNVHFKLFWKASWNAGFCVFHVPLGRSRRRQREKRGRGREPHCPHFDASVWNVRLSLRFPDSKEVLSLVTFRKEWRGRYLEWFGASLSSVLRGMLHVHLGSGLGL